jgi:hypothetical protein
VLLLVRREEGKNPLKIPTFLKLAEIEIIMMITK